MEQRGYITQEQSATLRERCKALMDEVAAKLIDKPAKGPPVIRPELWPSPDF